MREGEREKERGREKEGGERERENVCVCVCVCVCVGGWVFEYVTELQFTKTINCLYCAGSYNLKAMVTTANTSSLISKIGFY